MNFEAMSDSAIAGELGERIRARRLRLNRTQEAVAEQAGISISTMKKLEAGKGKLSTVIAVLRCLKALDGLDAFVPPVSVSPLQLARNKGVKRRRASRAKRAPSPPTGRSKGGDFVLKDGKRVSREDQGW